jgi:FkbM family methyltransferase
VSTYKSKWARSPRPAKSLGSVAKVRDAVFESDFFTTRCLEVSVDDQLVRYVGSNRLAEKRVHTLFTKEPTTIPWLETFASDDVFFDIGANVGMYSVYASVMTGCRTYGFEPEALNFAELNKNIFINKLHGRTTAYNLAISDEMRVGELYLGAFGYSYSHHDFNESTWKEDHFFGAKATKMSERLHQGCVSIPVDELIGVHRLPQPNHIKIDVDGLEHRVFASLKRTLQSPALKTVLIEIDFQHPACAAIIDTMAAAGWRCSSDQLRANRKKILAPGDVERMRRHSKGGLNYIFYKDAFYDDLFANFIANYVPPLAPAKQN